MGAPVPRRRVLGVHNDVRDNGCMFVLGPAMLRLPQDTSRVALHWKKRDVSRVTLALLLKRCHFFFSSRSAPKHGRSCRGTSCRHRKAFFFFSDPLWGMLWFLARAVLWEEAGLFRRPPQYFPRHCLTFFVTLNPEAGILFSQSNVIVEPDVHRHQTHVIQCYRIMRMRSVLYTR